MTVHDGDICVAPGGATLIHKFRGTRQWLLGPELHALLEAKVTEWAAEYEAIVARRTGELAGSTMIDSGVYIGEEAALTGYVKATARHAAPHEFGWRDNLGFFHPGSHELRNVMFGG